MQRSFLVLMVWLGLMAGGVLAQPSQPLPDTSVMGAPLRRLPPNFPDSCLSRVRVPPLQEGVGEYSFYLGYWPATGICQALVMRRVKMPQEKVPVTYVYEGNGTYPSGAISIPDAKYSSAEKKLTFFLPWRGKPEVVYNLSTGQAFYRDGTGTHEGVIIPQDGIELPFRVSS